MLMMVAVVVQRGCRLGVAQNVADAPIDRHKHEAGRNERPQA